MSYAFTQYTYQLPDLGTMLTLNSVDGFDSNGFATGTTVTVNDEPAMVKYRYQQSKRVVSKHYARSVNSVIACYLSTKSFWEICAEHND